jgi:hypothetical protein
MKIELSDSQVKVILAALEAFSRFRINQPKTALEAIFPKQYYDLGWDKMEELVAPIQKAFFPDYPSNGGPGICNPEIGKEPQIAYEIAKQIEQYVALKKSDGWFGSTVNFDGALLNPSGEPPPKIEGLEEMQYKDFLIPEESQDAVSVFVETQDYKRLWHAVGKSLMDLPRGEKMEVIKKYVNTFETGLEDKYYVRVYKPRKKVDDNL